MSSNSNPSPAELAFAEYQADLQIEHAEYLGLTEKDAQGKHIGPIHVEIKNGIRQESCGENVVRNRMHVEITDGVISKICGFG